MCSANDRWKRSIPEYAGYCVALHQQALHTVAAPDQPFLDLRPAALLSAADMRNVLPKTKTVHSAFRYMERVMCHPSRPLPYLYTVGAVWIPAIWLSQVADGVIPVFTPPLSKANKSDRSAKSGREKTPICRTNGYVAFGYALSGLGYACLTAQTTDQAYAMLRAYLANGGLKPTAMAIAFTVMTAKLETSLVTADNRLADNRTADCEPAANMSLDLERDCELILSGAFFKNPALDMDLLQELEIAIF